MDFSIGEIAKFLTSRRRREIFNPGLKRAAVLVGLFQKKGLWHLLMTKRSDEVEHHKGQISFPGGAVDAGDRDIVATALRETEEEIGLPPNKVNILGQFDDHATPTGFIITPVVGYIKKIPRLAPKGEEVVEILEVPASLFIEKGRERIVTMQRSSKPVEVYFYDFGKHEIWGATARISRDFLHELSATGKPL